LTINNLNKFVVRHFEDQAPLLVQAWSLNRNFLAQSRTIEPATGLKPNSDLSSWKRG